MGLDMCLRGKRFLWYNEKQLKNAIKLAFPEAPGSPSEVTVEVCYWRKANHIHKWFVDNVQDGEDDCKDYYVSREKLADLVSMCEKAIEDRQNASQYLPIQEGFFFGGIGYDEYYFNDIKHTIKTLKPLIDPNKYKGWDFEYHSSW